MKKTKNKTSGCPKFRKRLKRRAILYKRKKKLQHKTIYCTNFKNNNPVQLINHTNPGCYANPLGGCDPKISLEHYISKNILKLFGSISTNGTPWLPAGKTLKATSVFAANTLCKHHNSYLSFLDSYAGRLFGFLENYHQIKNRTFVFEGKLFERWMLKILIGLVSTNNMKGTPLSSIPKPWLEYLYGIKPLPSNIGLFCYFQKGQQILTQRKISITTLTLAGQLQGMKLELCGFGFWLSMVPGSTAFKPGAANGLIHRLKELRHEGNSTKLVFEW